MLGAPRWWLILYICLWLDSRFLIISESDIVSSHISFCCTSYCSTCKFRCQSHSLQPIHFPLHIVKSLKTLTCSDTESMLFELIYGLESARISPVFYDCKGNRSILSENYCIFLDLMPTVLFWIIIAKWTNSSLRIYSRSTWTFKMIQWT